MTYRSDLIASYTAVRAKLRRPPNAVVDLGVDLKRPLWPPVRPAPPPAPIEPTPKLEPPKPVVEVVLPCTMVPIPVILREVADWFGVTVNQIRNKNRSHKYVTPRHVAFYLMSKHTVYPGKIGLAGVARKLDYDHTTLIHAKRKIAKRMADSEQFSSVIRCLEDKIYASKAATAVPAVNEPALAVQSEIHNQEKSLPVEGVQAVDISGGPFVPQSEAIVAPQDVAGQIPSTSTSMVG